MTFYCREEGDEIADDSEGGVSFRCWIGMISAGALHSTSFISSSAEPDIWQDFFIDCKITPLSLCLVANGFLSTYYLVYWSSRCYTLNDAICLAAPGALTTLEFESSPWLESMRSKSSETDPLDTRSYIAPALLSFLAAALALELSKAYSMFYCGIGIETCFEGKL